MSLTNGRPGRGPVPVRARHHRPAERREHQGAGLSTATVCSKCADNCPSLVTAVQPSLSTRTAGSPMFTMGSIASTIPSASRGPRPGTP